MPQCRRRIGTTGTLDGTQTHKLVLEGLFGPVHRVTTTKSLIKNKQLADLDISCIILEHKEEHRKLARAFTYHDEMDFLTQHDKRNTFIRNLSLKQTGNTLVLFQFVEKHGKALFEDIKLKARQDRKVFLYTATQTHKTEKKLDVLQRQRKMQLLLRLLEHSLLV